MTLSVMIALFVVVARQSAGAFMMIRNVDAARRSNRFKLMMASSIKGVLFDKDGTLIDFDKTFGPATAAVIRDLAPGNSVLQQSLADKTQFDAATNKFHPESVVLAGSVADIASDLLPLLAPTRPDDDALELEDLIQEVDELYRKHSLASVAAFPFTASTLSELNRRGLKLGIATNDSEAAARQHMIQLELEHYFADKILGFDSGYGSKPDAGMIAAFLRIH